jgi:hypothetical protein
MPFFVQITLDDCVQGDTPTYEFDLAIDTPRTPSKVWMTAKLNATWPDGSAVFQVVGTIVSVIATSLVDNTRTWQTLFKLSSAQSANIPTTTVSGDVQTKLDNSDILTPVLFGVKSAVGYTATTA